MFQKQGLIFKAGDTVLEGQTYAFMTGHDTTVFMGDEVRECLPWAMHGAVIYSLSISCVHTKVDMSMCKDIVFGWQPSPGQVMLSCSIFNFKTRILKHNSIIEGKTWILLLTVKHVFNWPYLQNFHYWLENVYSIVSTKHLRRCCLQKGTTDEKFESGTGDVCFPGKHFSEHRECVFIITDKAKDSRVGGKRCRCYERRRAKVWGNWVLSHTRWI